MHLHNDRGLFEEVVMSTAEKFDMAVPIVEKDYYVTLILKNLSERCPECVFKGGTSLSKCYHAIERFSEDIDITFSDKLTQGMRKKLKNITIAGISKYLNMPIIDWDNTRSRRNYNCYTFSYEPIDGYATQGKLIQGVKMEVSLVTIAFPTVQLLVDSYVYQLLKDENMDIVDKYNLQPFTMNIQELERTFIDKVFAICDYYLQGKIKRYSRHLYDIYMLFPRIKQNREFKELVHQVRRLRATMDICPSAVDGVNIPKLLKEIVNKDVYRADYMEITTYFQNQPVEYEKVMEIIKEIAENGMFEV